MNFGIETRTGKKISRLIELTIEGENVVFPLVIIHGSKDGPTLTITAGIHGTEYSSIEAALRLGRTFTPEEVQGKVVILPIANIPSFKKRTIHVGPNDGKNLNRVFPGEEKGTFTEILAYHIFNELISKGDYYIDLHGGDMNEALVPFVIYAPSGNAEVDSASISMSESFGIDLIVRSETPGTAIYSASHSGIPAILAEAGGQGIWNNDTVNIHTNGLKGVMRQLGLIKGKPNRRPAKVFPFPWLFSEHDGLFYPRVCIGQKVSAGQTVGTVCDYFGRELQTAVSPTDGTVLFLVTSLAINKGDPLLGIGG